MSGEYYSVGLAKTVSDLRHPHQRARWPRSTRLAALADWQAINRGEFHAVWVSPEGEWMDVKLKVDDETRILPKRASRPPPGKPYASTLA